MKILKKYPLTIVCIIGIWILCMTPWFPETPLNNVHLIDKWTHIVMYLGLCSLMWIEYRIKHKGKKPNWTKIIVYTLICPTVMGGIVELAQAYLTAGHRSGEWMDFLADTMGVAFAFIIWSLTTWKISLKYK